MLLLPSARTCETRLPSEARIPRLLDSTILAINVTGANTVCFSLPQHGPRGTDINLKVLHKHLLFRRWATWARAWVKVEAKNSRPILQGPRGTSTLWYRRLSLQISLIYRVLLGSLDKSAV